jgi:hypothetical protein
LLTTGYKRLTEGGWGILTGFLQAACEAATGYCVSPEQLSAPRTLYMGFRKAMLKKS